MAVFLHCNTENNHIPDKEQILLLVLQYTVVTTYKPSQAASWFVCVVTPEVTKRIFRKSSITFVRKEHEGIIDSSTKPVTVRTSPAVVSSNSPHSNRVNRLGIEDCEVLWVYQL
jgi:hypothetical protein